MAKIIFLGTAASVSSPQRDSTSFLFLHKKELFLIDCPGSIVYKLLRVGINFRKLSNIIITHQHPDHMYGLPHLIHAQSYLNNKINIFSNKKVKKVIENLVKIMNLTSKNYPTLNFYNVFSQEFFYLSKDLKIKAIKNNHIEESFGIEFIFKKKLLYSSDTAISHNIVEEAKKCNYLIHDCTASSSFFQKHPDISSLHTDAKTLSKVFKNTQIEKIIPIHFLLLEKGEEKKIRKELAEIKDKIIFPSDYQCLTL